MPERFPITPRPLVIITAFLLTLLSFYLYYGYVFGTITRVETTFFNTVSSKPLDLDAAVRYTTFVSDFEPAVFYVSIRNPTPEPFKGLITFKTYEQCDQDIVCIVEVESRQRRRLGTSVPLELNSQQAELVVFYFRTLNVKEAKSTNGNQVKVNQVRFDILLISQITETQAITGTQVPTATIFGATGQGHELPTIDRDQAIRYWFISRLLVPPGVNFVIPLLIALGLGIGQMLADAKVLSRICIALCRLLYIALYRLHRWYRSKGEFTEIIRKVFSVKSLFQLIKCIFVSLFQLIKCILIKCIFVSLFQLMKCISVLFAVFVFLFVFLSAHLKIREIIGGGQLFGYYICALLGYILTGWSAAHLDQKIHQNGGSKSDD